MARDPVLPLPIFTVNVTKFCDLFEVFVYFQHSLKTPLPIPVQIPNPCPVWTGLITSPSRVWVHHSVGTMGTAHMVMVPLTCHRTAWVCPTTQTLCFIPPPSTHTQAPDRCLLLMHDLTTQMVCPSQTNQHLYPTTTAVTQ